MWIPLYSSFVEQEASFCRFCRVLVNNSRVFTFDLQCIDQLNYSRFGARRFRRRKNWSFRRRKTGRFGAGKQVVLAHQSPLILVQVIWIQNSPRRNAKQSQEKCKIVPGEMVIFLCDFFMSGSSAEAYYYLVQNSPRRNGHFST